jgi:hypothetical protein
MEKANQPPESGRKNSVMWIVQLALRRPYTFIVGGLLLLIVSPLVILRTPTDIFPNINSCRQHRLAIHRHAPDGIRGAHHVRLRAGAHDDGQ